MANIFDSAATPAPQPAAPKPASGNIFDAPHPATNAPPAMTRLPGSTTKANTHDHPLIRRVLGGLEWAASSPVGHAVDAVLNATSRVGTGIAAGKNPVGTVLDPAHATDTTHAAELNFTRLYNPTLLNTKTGPVTLSDAIKWAQKNPVASPILDFATETFVDPAMYIPGLDVFSIGKRAIQAARLAGKVSGLSRAAAAAGRVGGIGEKAAAAIDRAKGGIVEGHLLRKGVLRPGEDIVKGRESAARNALRRQEQSYSDLIDAHRPELERIQSERTVAQTRLAHLRDLEKGLDPQAARFLRSRNQPEIDQLHGELATLQNAIPPEIRTATLQRAYREGTPDVRRRVLAAGYKPTAEESAAAPLNILHRFNDEYEPTQHLFDETSLAKTAGPVRITHQGNRKAKFDLPKTGATPEDPLADRLLDRLVRGARLESYHSTRRSILSDLGLGPLPVASAQRTAERLAQARAAGDARGVARYGGLLTRQAAVLQEAAEKRARTLRPGADLTTQRVETLAPRTAQEQALRGLKREGRAGIEATQNRAGEHVGFLRNVLNRGTEDTRAALAEASAKNLHIRALDKARAAALQERGKVAKAMNRAHIQPPAPGIAERGFAKVADAVGERADHARNRAQNILDRLQKVTARNKTVADSRKAGEKLSATVNEISLPTAIQERLFGDKATYQKTLAREFSDLQRDALFVIPFAHMKNISVLTALGPGGPRTLMRGLKYAHDLRTNPDEFAARTQGLEQIGATQHYIRDVDSAFSHLPSAVGKVVDRVSHASNAALERYDMGMRLALEDELKRRGIEGFQAGGQIRDVLGDYENQAPFIQELRNRAGANFPGWRLGVVPRAMTKALREQPRAVKAYARANRLISDDVTVPTMQSEFDLGGPGEDYAKMLAAPQKFVTSPSSLGPVSDLFALGNAMKTGRVGEFLGGEGLRLLPGGSAAGNVIGFPYASNAPLPARALSGLTGAYFPERLSAKQRANQLRQLGMTGPEVAAKLKAEGYTNAALGTLQPMALPAGTAPAPPAAPAIAPLPIAPQSGNIFDH